MLCQLVREDTRHLKITEGIMKCFILNKMSIILFDVGCHFVEAQRKVRSVGHLPEIEAEYPHYTKQNSNHYTMALGSYQMVVCNWFSARLGSLVSPVLAY